MFKKGDRVRCVDAGGAEHYKPGEIKEGEIYTVDSVQGSGVRIKPNGFGWSEDRFELIPEGDENRPCPVEGRKASETQVGGDHYLNLAIQPIEFITKNELTFIEGNIVKYVCRHRTKAGDGAVAVRKIIHYARLLLELEYGEKE